MYGTELREALKRSTPVPEEKFTTQQQERSTRLFYILKRSLGSSARCQALIRIFEYEHDQKTQGYELARRLKEEFSIVTRAEALYFRNQLLSYRVKGGLSLKDLVHTMDAELLMFDRICLRHGPLYMAFLSKMTCFSGTMSNFSGTICSFSGTVCLFSRLSRTLPAGVWN